MRMHPNGESLWSEGVSSPLMPQAVWKLELYPSGEKTEDEDNISVFLYLTGPMV